MTYYPYPIGICIMGGTLDTMVTIVNPTEAHSKPYYSQAYYLDLVTTLIAVTLLLHRCYNAVTIVLQSVTVPNRDKVK